MSVEKGGSDTVGHLLENFEKFQPKLAYCPSAIKSCNGTFPCINTCGCTKSENMLDQSGHCVDMSKGVYNQLINHSRLPLEGKVA